MADFGAVIKDEREFDLPSGRQKDINPRAAESEDPEESVQDRPCVVYGPSGADGGE